MNVRRQPRPFRPRPGAVAQGRLPAAALLAILAGVLYADAGEGTSAEEAMPTARDRIVSLAPSVTETLLALDAGNRLVGVTRYHPPLPGASRAVRIGGIVDPSLERILALRPHLVIGLTEQADDLHTLAGTGIETLQLDHHSLEGVLASIRRLGEATGRSAEAERLAGDLAGRVEAVRERVRERPAPRVLVVVGRDRAETVTAGVWIAGRGTHYADLVETAGATLAYEGGVRYASVSPEGLVALAPEVILELEAGALSETESAARLRDWKALAHLPAVESGRVHILTGPLATVPGPRIVDLLETMAGLLHPPEETE